MTIASRTVATSEDFDLQLPSGRIHARRFGSPGAPLILCLPGISANLAGFDFLGERMGGESLQLVAIDFRGRGQSDVTPAGTYGWRNHARDVLGVADALGARTCSLIGQSSGAAIAMVCAQLEPSRVERIVLVDLCGTPDESSALPVTTSIDRLGVIYPSADAAVGLIKQLGIIPEWNEYWERYFRYELRETEGGVTASSNRGAVLEDLGYGNAMFWSFDEPPIHALWQSITMPSLVLRARQEIMPGFGYIVPKSESDRFAREVPGSQVVEIDANHYTINMHEDSAVAIEQFLGAR